MIKSNELRIGNWIIDYEVEPNKTIYYQIEEIKKRAIDKNRLDAVYRNGSVKCSLDWLTPIPLTEELLLKCGAKYLGFIDEFKDVKEYFLGNGITIDWHIHSDKCSFFYNNSCVTYYDDNEIKLHQLQNLYFELTGTELEIKL